MQCPFCRAPLKQIRVVDTRVSADGVRRRRLCNQCDRRFTTYERIISTSLFVVKIDERREEFSREKLLRSLRLACSKRHISLETIEAIAQQIETHLYELGRAEIDSKVVGEQVMQHLKELDDVAYIRFASVYLGFADVDSMAAEIARLQAEKQTAQDN